jgi:hypothetical protein
MRESFERGGLICHAPHCLARRRGCELEPIMEIFVDVRTIAMMRDVN